MPERIDTDITLPFPYPEEATLVPVTDIDMSGRSRQLYDEGELRELAASITAFGIVHPPTIDGNYRMIGGGRRFYAMKDVLGLTHIPVVFREKMPQYMVKELELEENLRRSDFTWQEKCLAMDELHAMRKRARVKMGKTWRQSDTGRLMGFSDAHVSHLLEVAKYLKAGDAEIIAAPHVTAAWNILLKRKEDAANATAAERFGPVKVTAPAERGQISGMLAPVSLADLVAPASNAASRTDFTSEHVTIELSKMLYRGDSVRGENALMLNLPDACVDHVVTDPPYAIDMKALDTFKDIDNVENEHDVTTNLEDLAIFIPQAYRVLRDGGFCVFWADESQRTTLVDWARKAGFKVTDWSYIWVKTSPCRNSAAAYNPTKSTEIAIICRKGNATLAKPWTRNWIQEDARIERKLYSNPFAKPFAVWKDILEHVATPGQTILDPFAGQMSCPRACLNLGYNVLAFELSELHYNHGINMLRTMLLEKYNNNVQFS